MTNICRVLFKLVNGKYMSFIFLCITDKHLSRIIFLIFTCDKDFSSIFVSMTYMCLVIYLWV